MTEKFDFKKAAQHAVQLGRMYEAVKAISDLASEVSQLNTTKQELETVIENKKKEYYEWEKKLEAQQNMYAATTKVIKADEAEAKVYVADAKKAAKEKFLEAEKQSVQIIAKAKAQADKKLADAAISAAGAVTEFNNISFSVPPDGFDEVQIPDTIEFRTFKTNHDITHDGLANFLRNRSVKWAYELARLEVVTAHAVTEDLKVPLTSDSTINGTVFSRDITSTAIGGTGNSVLTLPSDYTDFEMVAVTVVEDAGQTMGKRILTRTLENNATITNVRIAGNDTASWNRTARTLTLHETADTYTEAVLMIPRLS